MIRWRRAALQYACEACGAAPGHKCISISGKLKYEIHEIRAERARADGWKIIEDEDDRGPDRTPRRPDDEP